jgi:phage/plasmid primase-like uncharacterized protein
VWVCGDAGNVGAFPVLRNVRHLIIAADNDDAGRKSARACAARWRATGREVTVMVPPAPHNDWNDYRTADMAPEGTP